MTGTALLIFAGMSALLPIGTAVFWLRKTHGRKLPLLVGALTFFVFVNVLEGLLHMFCLIQDNGISRFLNSHMIAYGLYGAFAAGIFEETGRLLAFKTVLRKYREPVDGVTYGIGHGGIEVLLVLTANYLVYGFAALAPSAQTESLLPIIASITPFGMGLALLERIFAMIFHISASVLVFASVKDPGKRGDYPLAILLHAALDFPAVLYQMGVLPVLAVEGLIVLYSLAVAFFARKVYRSL